jgi:hypothetical protein
MLNIFAETWGHCPHDSSKDAPPHTCKTKTHTVPLMWPGQEDTTRCDITKWGKSLFQGAPAWLQSHCRCTAKQSHTWLLWLFLPVYRLCHGRMDNHLWFHRQEHFIRVSCPVPQGPHGRFLSYPHTDLQGFCGRFKVPTTASTEPQVWAETGGGRAVNWTKVQVPLQLTGKVSSKGLPPYHLTSA